MDGRSLLERLKSGEGALAVIGMGYVGLPVAVAFARHVRVIGFDINSEKVRWLAQGRVPADEVPELPLSELNIEFTDKVHHLREAICYIVTVPTPVDAHRVPDLGPLRSASETVGSVLKEGDFVIYESTVYPGCVEEVCVPILEERSGLQAGRHFKYGYSPERINPGDREHTLENVVKVVSGCDGTALEQIAALYDLVVRAGVYRAPSIKVAEAAKVIENTQRDLNIALMNELSLIFDRMGLNTYEVIDAAATKWNFMRFTPGLVGGHCISVDPYYLTYKSQALGYTPQVILAGRKINDEMPLHIVRKVLYLLSEMGKAPGESTILQIGLTFKENVADMRNSKAVELAVELQRFNIQVEVYDPLVSQLLDSGFRIAELPESLSLLRALPQNRKYDIVIVAVPHQQILSLTEKDFASLLQPRGVLMDLKGKFYMTIRGLRVWTL